MTIQQLNVYDHKVNYGSEEGQHQRTKDFIATTLKSVLSSEQIDRLDVYNLDGTSHTFNAGRESREIIFINGGASSPMGAVETAVKFDNVAEITISLLPSLDSDNVINISDNNGIVVAQYFKDLHEMYILFNLFEDLTVRSKRIFSHIIEQWHAKHFKILALQNSWLHTDNKTALTSRFTGRLQDSMQREIRQLKENLGSYERNIEEKKRQIKQYYDNMINARIRIEASESNLGTVTTKFIEQLDIVSKHPKVSDLHIVDGIFKIFVPDVYAYDKENRRYYIGNCRIEINMENTEVRFYGDNQRGSYWSRRDPHPHVDGRNGGACLGSVSATIAELCSRNEIYALILTGIDFLENVNIDDPAGRCVRFWDEVDEEGNVINEGVEYDRDR